MRTKVYWGLGVLIVLLIGAFVFVMVNQYAENRQLERDLAEAVKKLEAHNKEADTPQVVDISDTKPPNEPGFVWVRHGDHWDKVPIDNPTEPTEDVVLVEEQDYIYDPNREKPDGWKPELVYEIGDKKVDLNYRPLTEEEQAEYERLKEAKNIKTYNATIEASLRILAIGKVKELNSDKILSRLDRELATNRISIEEARKQIRDYNEFFAVD